VSGVTGPVTVLGAGSWGTALATHLGRQGAATRLWGRDPALVKEIGERRENARYLPGISVPAGVDVVADAGAALAGAGIVVVAVPSHGVESVLGALGSAIPPDAALLSAAKGLEPVRGDRVSVVLARLLPRQPWAVLSGPSFAREVALGLPAALVVASDDESLSRSLQQALASPTFRLYTNRDVIGVEISGALKNVIAIATGLADGLELGENARAALITRGLAEMVRLGVALGAQPTTFLGLAGLGDLVLTCTGSLSRNRALGREVARGRALPDVERGTRMIAEGVRTVSAAVRLAREAGIAMPICEEVRAVLFDRKPVTDALSALLAREPRPEEDPARRIPTLEPEVPGGDEPLRRESECPS
jgi:glycerol-3-phosphate dehydrogenase (NAD(P)+)